MAVFAGMRLHPKRAMKRKSNFRTLCLIARDSQGMRNQRMPGQSDPTTGNDNVL
jgi:hypothetical protein